MLPRILFLLPLLSEMKLRKFTFDLSRKVIYNFKDITSSSQNAIINSFSWKYANKLKRWCFAKP